ncbi:MAG: hypothetical protein B7Y97_09800 [Sphingomonas sp. 32-66-10]|nr:MAG: hypothetical protein B7Y97_09800 [Sphingomonas sp. 32-66-10]
MSLALAFAGLVAADCSTATTQSEMNDCALAAYNEADVSLNVQWWKTLAVFRSRSVEDAERLRAAQRAWIAFRDAECDAEFPFSLGVSLDKGLNINCRTSLTLERTVRLAELELAE